MADALGIAEGLHEYFRQSGIVQMAFYAQTVNVIGAVKTSRTSAQMETTGLVLELYRRHFGNVPFRLNADYAPLDVVAALADDGRALTVAVVNPTENAVALPLELSGVKITGKGTRWCVAGRGEFDRNEPGKARAVDIAEKRDIDDAQGVSVPPLSASVFVFPITLHP